MLADNAQPSTLNQRSTHDTLKLNGARSGRWGWGCGAGGGRVTLTANGCAVPVPGAADDRAQRERR